MRGQARVRQAALTLALVLALPTTAGASWAQDGGDATRSGFEPYEAPVRPDLALNLTMPGSLAPYVGPIVVQNSAYVPVADIGVPGLSAQGIVRVELATGKMTLAIPLQSPPLALASDGERILLARAGSIEAYGLDGGPPLWALPTPMARADYLDVCASLAVVPPFAYVACTQVGGPADVVPFARIATFLVAVDLVSGKPAWWWHANPDEDALAHAAEPPSGPPRTGAPRTASVAWMLSVVGPTVLLSTIDLVDPGAPGPAAAFAQSPAVYAFEKSVGKLVWNISGEAQPYAFVLGGPSASNPNPVLASAAVGTSSLVAVKLGALLYLNPERGKVIFRKELNERDRQAGDPAGGLGFAADGVYAASLNNLYKLDFEQRIVWNASLDPASHEGFAPSPPFLTHRDIVARAFRLPGERERLTRIDNALLDYDASSGALRWRYDATALQGANATSPEQGFRFAASDHAIVLAGVDGSFVVLGETPASILPKIGPTNTYPSTNASFGLDATPTEPGAQGPPTEFSVDWGDGTNSTWQASPKFTHIYATSGDREALLHARNTRGQTATTSILVRVGVTPPHEATLLERAFGEWQNYTFFALSLLATATAAILGTLRSTVKRRLLKRELRELQEEYDSGISDAERLEAMLDSRRSRAHDLLAEKRLDQSHHTVLLARIDELSQAATPRLPVRIRVRLDDETRT